MESNLKELLQAYKMGDLEKLSLIIDKFKPSVNKYARLLFRNEKEDTISEFNLALLEAASKITCYENEGQCITYFNKAITNKFLELYRKSIKYYNNETNADQETLENTPYSQNEYNAAIFKEDIHNFILNSNESQQKILYSILINDESDYETAKKYNVSRQYVNRIRRKAYEELKKLYYK